jgi:hypothetical protein
MSHRTLLRPQGAKITIIAVFVTATPVKPHALVAGKKYVPVVNR